VVLHELATGEKPYVSETAMGVIYCHANAPIPRLPPTLGHLQPLLDTLLAKDPARRPSAAAEIVTLIVELLAGVAA
jgi:serine/threonine protein kinase